MLPDESLREAERLMTVCNSCRYCEGLCAVFPAMEMRRVFAEGDLDHLANLCHSCGACHDDCQFAPPHEFAVNVPLALARVRRDSWERHAWPSALAGLFRRSPVAMAVGLSVAVGAFLLAMAGWNDAGVLFTRQAGPGAFYRLLPHDALAVLFGGAFLYAALALTIAARRFTRSVDAQMPLRADARSIVRGLRDAATLKYLDGGGVGCVDTAEEPADRRRLFHHLAFYGFLLCFAATAVATLYHYLLGREAPYPWYDVPMLLGSLGGAGLIIGPLGLMRGRRQRRAELKDESQSGMDNAFSLLLVLVSVTGLALLLARATALMGVLLAIHLGVVFTLFAMLPYSRFVHGIYRVYALVRHAREMHELG